MSDDPTQPTPAENGAADETESREVTPEHAAPQESIPDKIAPEAAAAEGEAVSDEAAPEEVVPDEATSDEVEPAESESAESASDEVEPTEPEAAEAEPAESEAGELESVEEEAAEAEPGEAMDESTEEPVRTAPAPRIEAPRTPDRWLVLQASAVLAAVAVTNYVCYGGASVPRYGEAPVPQPPRDPSILCAEIIARGPASESQEGVLRLAELDLRFRQVEQSERQVIWAWNELARWLQVYWVWDFFRLQSHIALRVGLPAPGQDIASGWAGTLAAVRAIAPGDTISVRVQSPCGNIHQVHPVTAAAVEWQPPAPPDPRQGLRR